MGLSNRTDRASDTARLLPAVASMALALAVIGASLGAIAVSSGVPLWLVTVMAALVFAGGSELLVVGLTTAGAAPVTALLGGWLLNARHLPYGLALGDVMGEGIGRKLFGSHLLVDEAVAFALAESEPARQRRAYWVAGVTLYCVWAPSVLLGGLLGRGLGDPQLFGLDAALPAGLLTLVLPSLRDRSVLRAVLLGCLLAVLTVPLFDQGLAVLIALLGTVAALPLPNDRRSRAGEGGTA
ncbi:4-azaleucine resistance probable transporter AzlC [Actinopolyspora xinjiangensis]|uniref:4-azaleucine resistance probable transporter AzlC n=1 Tax=Actinopolyspora xinjiangensis TaxID=405564 RepID=A0A1H0TQN4_9ACTN|nr:AzlC family ABC transporter permease [Actinopolyspora xinjiangensis]SDP56382.1 4-azaleucine resistance probable transporter AzlC [Actinopolyspora xinjiangensis]